MPLFNYKKFLVVGHLRNNTEATINSISNSLFILQLTLIGVICMYSLISNNIYIDNKSTYNNIIDIIKVLK